MTDWISDAALRAVEQGILGLLLALGTTCLLVFFRRWRAVNLARGGTSHWRTRLEKDLSEEMAGESAPSTPRAGEAG